MIIDCHGHYTTAPKALESWRNAQIAGIQDAALKPKKNEYEPNQASHHRLPRPLHYRP